LELIQSRPIHSVIAAMAVAFESGRDAADFGLQLLLLARLREQHITLMRENLVDALVASAADVSDQLPQLCEVFDCLCSRLPDPRGGPFDHELPDCFEIAASD